MKLPSLKAIKVIPDKFFDLEKEYKSLNSQDDLPRIAICGTYNAGKSSLLNALTANIDNEYFPTNAARCTAEVKELEHENMCFIDAPGLDANEEDNTQAWNGLIGADQIIYVHNAGTRVIDQTQESFFLELIARNPIKAKKMIVVFSYMAAVSDLETFKTQMHSAFKKSLGFEPECFYIDNKTHANAVLKKNQLLLERAGIDVLYKAIKTRFENDSWLQDREKHRHYLIGRMNFLLNKSISKLEKNQKELEQEMKDSYSEASKDVRKLRINISKRLNEAGFTHQLSNYKDEK
jgi:tRNA U34 5-carboxymethylaminomethyl modifying GTPase MnmE/TrmE